MPNGMGGTVGLSPTPGATVTVELDASVPYTIAEWTAGENETVELDIVAPLGATEPANGQRLMLVIVNDGTIPRTITFGSGFTDIPAIVGVVGQRSVVLCHAVGGAFIGTARQVGGQLPAHAHDLSACWPVGSVFISVVATDPATLLGFGTWAALGAGRMLVGFDNGDGDFDTLEETGGAKTVTLTANEMPAHSHVQDSHNHVQNAHSHVITSQTATTGSATSYEHGTLDTSSAEAEATETTAAATATNQAATAVNQNTGGGAAHQNMPPFLVCRFWKRTA